MLQAGQVGLILLPADHPLWKTRWWPVGIETTGTVQKVYKNGTAMVGVHQLPNNSEDGCRSLNFTADLLTAVDERSRR